MRGFSDAERERIRAELFEVGRELFARHGLSKTTIADLTAPLEVAPSTFYQFYDSKSDFYLDVLRRERAAIETDIVEASFGECDDPETAIRTFLQKAFEEIATNALLRQLLVPAERTRLRRALPPEALASFRRETVAAVADQLRPYQQAGQLRDGDVDVVANAIRAVTLLSLHEQEVGDPYPETRELLIDAVSVGLTTPEAATDGTD